MVSHKKENYTVREECRQRTRLELLCYIGNAYFSQIVLVSGPKLSNVHNIYLEINVPFLIKDYVLVFSFDN